MDIQNISHFQAFIRCGYLKITILGNPVPNPLGGYYDHLTEMKQSYTSLNKIKKGLEGSLKNPNLSSVDRELLQNGLDIANSYINRIEELFKPFGGI